jgi:hypothetical protein
LANSYIFYDYIKSLNSFNQLLKILEELFSRDKFQWGELYIRTYFDIAGLHTENKNYKEGLRSFESAYLLSKKLSQKNDAFIRFHIQSLKYLINIDKSFKNAYYEKELMDLLLAQKNNI